MKYINSHNCTAIILEEGDYNLHPNKVRGMHVDYIFIPESESQYYTVDSPLYNQLMNNIAIMGVDFGQLLTYKTFKHEHESNS